MSETSLCDKENKAVDMTIFVKTSSPGMLVDSIREKIKSQTIKTWTVDEDGDMTHAAEQWKYNAWIRTKIEPGLSRVVFYIICRNDRNLSVSDYAIYHGRFVEMLLTHFDKDCQSIEVTALASKYDSVVAFKKNG